MNRIRYLWQRVPVWIRLSLYGTVVVCWLAGMILWTTWQRTPTTRINEDGVAVPVNPWQIPGQFDNQRARIWVDPQTGCHYLVAGGQWGWNLVPRTSADGRALVCNQPVPVEAQ